MILIAGTVVLGICVGLLAGGHLRDFPSAPVRYVWLAAVGLALHLVPATGDISTALSLLAAAALVAFSLLNLDRPGFSMVLTGSLLDLVAVAANIGSTTERIPWLGEVISLRDVAGVSLSPGDVLVYLGAVWFIAAAIQPRHSVASAETDTAA